MNQKQRQRLEQAIEMKENILIAGTSGKKLFHGLLKYIAQNTNKTIIGIIGDENVSMAGEGDLVYLLGRNDKLQSKLLQMIPKINPEWVAVDQIRGTAAVDMLAVLECGYAGIMTLEAVSAYQALTTLENFIKSKVNPDEKMIADKIDLIICMEHSKCKVKEFAELRRYAFSEYQLTYI